MFSSLCSHHQYFQFKGGGAQAYNGGYNKLAAPRFYSFGHAIFKEDQLQFSAFRNEPWNTAPPPSFKRAGRSSKMLLTIPDAGLEGL